MGCYSNVKELVYLMFLLIFQGYLDRVLSIGFSADFTSGVMFDKAKLVVSYSYVIILSSLSTKNN